MHAQTKENDFVSAFRSQLTWLPGINEFNPFVLFNPIRRVMFAYNQWRMDRFVSKVMDERFATRPGSKAINGSSKCNRPVIDLALDAYLEEEGKRVPPSTLRSSALLWIKSRSSCLLAMILPARPSAT